MTRLRRNLQSIAVLAPIVLASAAWAQTGAAANPAPDAPVPAKFNDEPDLLTLIRNIRSPFLTQKLPPIPMADPESVAELIDDKGEIHLTAHQAISLALANNLDIASARLLKRMAKTDIQRAGAGQLLRNVPTSTNAGPSTAAGPLASATASGSEGIQNSQPGILSDLSVQLAGSQIPRLDPVFYANGSYSETNIPQANAVIEGTYFLQSQTQQWQAGYQQGFLIGTTIDANVTGVRLSQNAPNNSINPSVTADAAIRVTQPLLQGFGPRVNSRAIHIAKINDTISSYTLREQVTLTVAQVLTLYYDLAAFREQLAVAEGALDRSRALLVDNKKRLDLGLLSQGEYSDNQAAVDANEQLVADAETQIAEQEANLKTFLTRRGLADPRVFNARIYPSDTFTLPLDDSTFDTPEQVADRAVEQRLEVARAALELQSSRLTLLGTSNAVKPILNIYAVVQTNGLAGRVNPYAPPSVPPTPNNFLGGYGEAFSQIGQGSYPNYEFGFQLNVPLTNAAARADNDRAELGLQQQRIQTEQLINAVRLQAAKSAFALDQARRQYIASVRNHKLRQQTLDLERKIFDLGTAAMGQMLNAQHELDLAELQESTARNTYVRALINVDSVLNETLERNHIVIDDPPAKPERPGARAIPQAFAPQASTPWPSFLQSPNGDAR
jgi:outer membrane protein TolC